MKKHVLTATVLSFLSFAVTAQQIEECPTLGEITLASYCDQSCVICDDLDGYTGTNASTNLGQAPPGFCAGQLHNTQWVGFVAGSTNLSIQISVYDCSVDQDGNGVGDGLQIGIYGTTDCQNFDLVSNCDDQTQEGASQVFTTNQPLTVGGIYFLVIDGAYGDICSFSIDVLSGNTNAPQVDQVTPNIDAPLTTCPGGNIDISVDPIYGAGAYYWTLDGDEVATDLNSTITMPTTPGTYTLCVLPYNPCSQGVEECVTIEVEPLVPSLFVDLPVCSGESSSYAGYTFDTEGVYEITLDQGADCDVLAEITVSVIEPIEEFMEAQICAGEPFQIGNRIFYDEGSYTVTLQSSQGCDSVINLDLYWYNDGQTVILEETICEGDAYEIGDDMLTQAGIYSYILQDSNGCDSIIDLTLTVRPTGRSTTTARICQGEVYRFNNVNYTTPGTYTATIVRPGRCDSIAVLNLSVSNDVTRTITTAICSGETYQVGNQSFSSSGTYNVTLQAANGCDSLVTLNLSVNNNIVTTQAATICQGESYTVGNQTYTQSGTYDHPGTSVNGCDSTFRLQLNVRPDIVRSISPRICAGETYSFGGQTFSTAGNYQVTLQAANGCDSITNIQLSVTPQITNAITASICAGETYAFNGNTLSASGMYSANLTAASGCDSIVNLQLTVRPNAATTLNRTVCVGESVTVGGQSFNQSGSYNVGLQSFNGCDSVVTLNLNVLPAFTTTLNPSICGGSSYSIAGDQLTSAGTYTYNFTANNGCDSIVTVNLSIEQTLLQPLNITLCQGESYQVGGSNYNASGYYENQFITADGCDSIVQLQLNVLPVRTTNLTQRICQGESYVVGNQTYTQSGNFSNTLTGVNGCDSIVNLQLTVIDYPVTPVEASICQSGAYQIGGQSFTTAGQYTVNLASSLGCDSTVLLTLNVEDFYETNLNIQLCEGESYQVGNNSYTAGGNYQNMFTSQEGCDSIVNLALTVFTNPTAAISTSICQGEQYSIGGVAYNATGIFTEVVSSQVTGCDSTITLNLTVNPTYNLTLSETVCLGESVSVGGQTFNASGTYPVQLMSQNGCDSTVTLNLLVRQPRTTQLNRQVCEGDTVFVNNQAFTQSGQFQEVLTSLVTGCDSIVNLNLDVVDLPETPISAVICGNESYTLAGETFSATGNYAITLSSANTGCDSLLVLDLLVNPVFDLSQSATICEGESVSIGAQTFSSTGTFPVMLSTAQGCDSLVTLQLTVLDILQNDIQATICEGESYSISNTPYTQSGNYSETLQAASGCDSIVNLQLNVLAPLRTPLSQTLCAGETYTVGDETFSTSGQYQVDLTAASGCDSLVTLQLTVNDTFATAFQLAACSDEGFLFDGQMLFNSGTYQAVFATTNGCDSTVTLQLTVAPCALAFEAQTEDNACFGEAQGSISFALLEGTAPYTYTYQAPGQPGTPSGSGSIASNGEMVQIGQLPQGNYQIFVTDANGVAAIINATVQSPPLLVGALQTSAFGNFEVTCADATDGSVSASAQGGTAPYTYAWDNGQQTASISNLAAGSYQVSITDRNGCLQVLQTTLDAPAPIEAELLMTAPVCDNTVGGSIQLEGAFGGNPPYAYALDAQNFGNIGLFTGVAPGMHTVTVRDANGCELQVAAEMEAAPVLTVELGETIYVNYGDSIQLLASPSYPVSSYKWTGGYFNDCSDCPSPMVTPQMAITYRLTVTDDNGCSASDEVLVRVIRSRGVFVPGAFSPNGDGNNDVLFLFGGAEVDLVESFVIFNRWGESVHEAYNFLPNDPGAGWDGRYRGQMANAAVYVYAAKVRFTNGDVEVVAGDVVLMR